MELRPGYKQTEVGAIPEEWCVKELDECVQPEAPICYGILMPGFHCHGGVPVIKVKDVVDGRIDEAGLLLTHPSIDEAYKRSRLAEGDLLITIRGTTGRVALVPHSLSGANITQDTSRLRVRRSISPEYLYHALQSAAPQHQISLHTIGQAVKGINIRDVRRVAVPFPVSALEQRAIAEALSDVDRLLGGLDRLIAKKRDLKQAAMQRLLTGQTRLPGFKGEWEVKRLGEMADTDPESLGSDTNLDFAFNYISLEDVDQGALKSYSEQLFGTAPGRARRKLRNDDVLVATVRPNLKSHLLFRHNGQHWVCSTGFCVVRCRTNVTHPAYMFFHLFGHQVSKQIEALLTGSNYPAINSGDVRALEIPFPDYQEQTAIATVLSDMDAELAALEARRDKTRALKQAMMQELLTGRTRLI